MFHKVKSLGYTVFLVLFVYHPVHSCKVYNSLNTIHVFSVLTVLCNRRVGHLCINSALLWLSTLSFFTEGEICPVI